MTVGATHALPNRRLPSCGICNPAVEIIRICNPIFIHFSHCKFNRSEALPNRRLRRATRDGGRNPDCKSGRTGRTGQDGNWVNRVGAKNFSPLHPSLRACEAIQTFLIINELQNTSLVMGDYSNQTAGNDGRGNGGVAPTVLRDL
jgi:hypothetical protein